jgi:hypothetical protein
MVSYCTRTGLQPAQLPACTLLKAAATHARVMHDMLERDVRAHRYAEPTVMGAAKLIMMMMFMVVASVLAPASSGVNLAASDG